jgi:hypothetical protein
MVADRPTRPGPVCLNLLLAVNRGEVIRIATRPLDRLSSPLFARIPGIEHKRIMSEDAGGEILYNRVAEELDIFWA